MDYDPGLIKNTSQFITLLKLYSKRYNYIYMKISHYNENDAITAITKALELIYISC